MTWREKTLIRVLLLVAYIVAPEEFRDEIKKLAAHISVWAPETKKEKEQ